MELVLLYHAEVDRVIRLATGADKFIHVQAGLLIWCAAALALRRSLRAWPPLAVVFAAEIGNEVMDRLYAGSWRWHDTSADAVATWFWPVILCLVLRADRARVG